LRKIVLLIMVLIFSLTLSSAAFASQSGDFVFYGDSQVGSVTDGYHGYSWNHSDSDGGRIVNVFNNYYHRWYRGYNNINWHRNWDYDRDNELYSYIDDNGVSHYFYLDPDRNYEPHQYKDENGITQFSFKDIGWRY